MNAFPPNPNIRRQNAIDILESKNKKMEEQINRNNIIIEGIKKDMTLNQ